MKREKGKVAQILKSSGPSKRAGLKKGDEVVKINGRALTDALDIAFAEGGEEAVFALSDGREISVKKREGEPFGLEFDQSLEISPKFCANKCVFCFVDQNPKGLRDTLYIKDDDYRLSFIGGTYVTCTNLSETDIKRIIEYKLSPLYVSVHAADNGVRNKLLGVKRSKDILEILKRLAAAGIKIYAQIVLVPTYNDGKILAETLEKLKGVGDNLLSVAVVPVGLTKHRDGLPALRVQTKEEAAEAIKTVEAFYRKYPFFAYCSDEMYERAGLETKPYGYYGDFGQIENGVGLVAKFLKEFEEGLEDTVNLPNKKIALITGVSGAGTMEKARAMLRAKNPRFETDIFVVENNFFGHSVTVAGLTAANDIINRMKNVDLSKYDAVFIPKVMLREFDTVFLDNIPLGELEEKLNKKITVAPSDGYEFVEKLTGV